MKNATGSAMECRLGWIAGVAGVLLLARYGSALQFPGPVPAPRPAGAGVAANNERVFVLRGDTLVALDARTLRPEGTISVPADGTGTGRASGPPDLRLFWSRGQARGDGPVRLTSLPMRLEDVAAVTPLGLMVHAHVTPSDHLGITPRRLDVSPDHYDVVAPADGAVVWLQKVARGNPDPGVQGRRYQGEYALVIEHSRTVYSVIGLIEVITPELMAAVGGQPTPGPGVNLRFPVKAGQVIGKMGGGHGLDYSLVDLSKRLNGFIRPEQFESRDPAKLHIVDPFDYMEPGLRERAVALNPRKAPPLGGKIDFDVPGKLAGNWYRQDTGGYAGLNRRLDYWVGHLTYAYHHVDPSKVVVSIGDFEGRPRQFWVRGNTPDPALVGEKQGVVKYDLVFSALGSNGQRYEGIDTDRVLGVALAQVLPGNRLRFEAFPNRTSADVKGFSPAAAIYER